MARGVDHLQDRRLARELARLRGPRQAHVLRLDGDATLALDVHVVEVLVAHVARIHHVGQLENAVGEGRFAVVDVGDDAEVPDPLRIGERLLREIRRLRSHRSAHFTVSRGQTKQTPTDHWEGRATA